MPDEKISLAQQIRDKLDAGLLPRVLPEKVFTRNGTGDPCAGCSQPIFPAQVEYEFETHRLHAGCAGMWQAELRRRGLVPRTRTIETVGAILRLLRSHPGRKYCAPCLATAAGIADVSEVRRVMDRANDLLDLPVVREGCDTCHAMRRTLAMS